MTLSEELTWRGFYNQTTFTTPETLDTEKFSLYLGTDPSADSLHVGHLAVYMMVRRFLDRGHKVVLLVGGGTGVIGDPSGKSDERNLLDLDVIGRNKAALAAQVSALFSGQEFTLVDNYDWLHKVSILDFLRDAGKHFGMSTLVQRDYIATRIGEGGSGMSFAEFSYTLLQGYDYWHLFNNYGVNLQIGGSDQWGNILSGVDLIRKKEGASVHGMTAPLVINKATGKKFGKSEAGAVWLDETKTSVYQFYQFWLNVDDESAIDYLKLFTLMPREEVESLEKMTADNPAGREAQKVLAFEVTKLVHGEARAEQARNVTAALFGGTPFNQLFEEELEMLAREIPVSTSSHVLNALVTSGVASSNGEARRLIDGGAISVNGEKVTDDMELPVPSLIKKGKNSFILVR